MADTQIVGSVSSEDGITWKLHPGNSASGLKGNTPYKVRPVGPEKTVTTLPEVNLQTMTASVSPNPPAAGQPFTVVFNVAPDTAPGLTGTGITRSGTAPASGNVVINATKAGFNPLQVTSATQPAVAPAATGGALTLFQGSVFLEIPNITAGYPEPILELTALTRNGADITAEMIGTDEIPDAVKTTSSTYSATWTITNGVGAGETITRTLVVAAAAITPTVEPVPARLYASQTPAAIPNIDTFLNNTNYSSGTAQLQVNGENATTETVLAEGDVVSVLVTGSGNLFRRWTLSTVEYALKFVSKGAGGWVADINDLIPSSTFFDLGFDEVTKSTNRGLIGSRPVHMADPYITLDGEVFEVHVPEPWINLYSAGPITYEYQWRRNGSVTGMLTAAARGKTYTKVAADAGTTISCSVTARDSINASSPILSSNSIAVPAAQVFEPYTALPGHYRFQSGSNIGNVPTTWDDLDIGAAHPDRDILVNAGQIGLNGGTVTGATIVAGGQTIPMTLVRSQATGATTPSTHIAVYHAKVPLGTTASITMTTSSTTSFRYIDYRRGVKNTISGQGSASTGTGATLASVEITGATVGHKVLAFHARPSTGDVRWTGATEIYDLDPTGGTTKWIAAADGVVPEGGTVTVQTRMFGGVPPNETVANTQSALIVIAAGE